MNTCDEVPVFPLRTVLFPDGPLPLRIFEARYIDMVSRCLKTNTPFAVSAIVSGDETTTHQFQDIGTLARLTDFETLPDGLLGVVARGEQRVRILESERRPDGLFVARLERLAPEPDVELPDGFAGMACLLREFIGQLPELYRDVPTRYGSASWVGYRLAELLPIALAQKQYFLEMEDAMRRMEILHPLIESLQDEESDWRAAT